MGSCMIPPITGAMHHTVSKDPHALLATESCVCGTDYCNSEKPEVTIPEKMKCKTFVTLEAMGTTVSFLHMKAIKMVQNFWSFGLLKINKILKTTYHRPYFEIAIYFKNHLISYFMRKIDDIESSQLMKLFSPSNS